MEDLGSEEVERALVDLGPLLGVSIKEEVTDEAADATPATTGNHAGASAESGPGELGEAGVSGGGAEGEGADSMASPGGGSAPLSAARCVLCNLPLVQLDGTPKLMECLHSACEPCVKAKIEEKLSTGRDFLGAERMTITCPVCRLQCQPANMIDQRFVMEKMELQQAENNGGGAGEQRCSSCEDTEPATSYCADCAEFICDSCVTAHRRLKITKEHTIKSKDSALAELGSARAGGGGAGGADMFCREHPAERLALFCETCDRLTCRDCQLQHHRDHKYQFSEEMAAQARASISSLLSEVSYKRVLLGSAMKVIRDRQQLIADKKKALVHDITQTVVKLTNAINTRGKQLVLRLNEVCDAKLRTLGEKKQALEQLAGITEHCCRFVAAALEQASDTALLHSKRAVCAQLQRVKSRRADIPNPEIPVRISLALDQLPDLMRVLSTLGAIVVDGKVDGGGVGGGGRGGGAQGPYHPPHGAGAGAGTGTPPHSAVAALQHAVMHQSFGVGGGGGGGGLGGAMGLMGARRAPAPLPHVTSTTHPHYIHGMSEMNLRGLLSPAGGGRPRAVMPAQAQAQAQAQAYHAYHQMLNAYGGGGGHPQVGPGPGVGVSMGRRQGGGGGGGPRTPSPAPPPQLAKWHIPQHNMPNGNVEPSMSSGGGVEFKIALGRPPGGAPRAPPPALVTSTNPKTPSPSPSLQVGAEVDAACAASVQELMAALARLDAHGVHVLAERAPPAAAAAAAAPPAPREPASPAPHVHSSTEPTGKPLAALSALATAAASGGGAGGVGGAADPNEDWCAVCMDGGELMCCDKCPKVFHQYCHIPTIEKLPDESETWQCLLCVNFAELPEEGGGAGGAGGPDGEGEALTPRQQKIVERITLELYCQYELSLPFREPVSAEDLHYHSKVSQPMCLDMIRMKLQPRAAAGRYARPAHFAADCRLMFRNAKHYYPPESQIYKDAVRLEEFFEAQLAKWLPELALSPAGAPSPSPSASASPWADCEPPHKRARH